MKYFLLTVTFYLIVGIAMGQVEQGLVAKYYFNDQSFDDEVGNIDGTPYNMLFTTDRFNNPFAAIGFMSDDQSSVSFGDNFDEIFAHADGSFSFSFWVKTGDTSINSALIISKYGNSNCGEDQREFFITINTDKRVALVYYSALEWSSYRIIEGSKQILDTLWHHVVVNYEGAIDENNGLDRINMYIDYDLQELTLSDSMGILGDIQNGTAHLSLGTALGSGGNLCGSSFYYGHFDDFRIYNRLLSVAEVDTLFNEPNPFTGNFEYALQPYKIDVFPNPFTTTTTLSYNLDKPSTATINIFNHQGQIIEKIEQEQPKGEQQVQWNAEGLPAGMYYFRIQAGDMAGGGKMVKME